jgi:hypothetical protein
VGQIPVPDLFLAATALRDPHESENGLIAVAIRIAGFS